MKTSILTIVAFCLVAFSLNGNRNYVFTENKGQWNENVEYKTKMRPGAIYFEQNRWLFTLGSYDPLLANIVGDLDAHGGHGFPNIFHAVEFAFTNTNPSAQLTVEDESPWYYNYLLGNDNSKWASNVKSYKTLNYNNLYNNINLEIYQEKDHLKYNFIVAPEGNPNEIEMQINGADYLFLLSGNLNIQTSIGDIVDLAPKAWQIINGLSIDVPINYQLDGNTLRFNLPEGYNESYELIVDPELIFSTYSGSEANNYGYSATYDALENSIGAGVVFDVGYPTTTGVLDESFNGGSRDAGISKFTSDQGQLMFSTYYGGSSDDHPHSMIVNSEGNLLVFGTSQSIDLPITANSFDNATGGNYDIYAALISADGTTLINSTYFGGPGDDGINISNTNNNYGDQFRGEINLDDSGNVLIASITASSNLTSPNAYQASLNGNYDGIALKFNADLSNLIWATYIGGSGEDAIYNIKEADNGNIYVCGGTEGGLETSANALSTSFNGELDGFVMALNSTATEMVYSTYLGGSAYSQTFFNDFDPDGNVVVFGQSDGEYDYPPYAVFDEGSSSTNFIHLMSPDLSSIIFTSRFNGAVIPTALSIDICGKIYVSGWSDNDGLEAPLTPDAYQSDGDGQDFHFIVLNPDGGLHYATYFGSTAGGFGEHVDGGTSRFSPNGFIHQAICGEGSNDDTFPTTPGSWSQTTNSGWNLAVVKFFLEPDFVNAEAIAEAEGGECGGSTYSFSNIANFPGNYYWDFGDGNTSNETAPTHTYENVGEYNVQLTIVNEGACNSSDTSSITLQVINTFDAEFEAIPEAPCENNIVNFNNTSQIDQAIEDYDFLWDFGDGNTSTEFSPTYEFEEPGEYTVSLTVSLDDCVSTDSTSIWVSDVFPEVELSFTCQVDENGLETGIAQLFIDSTNDTDTVIGGNNFGFYNTGDTITVTAISFAGCEDTESIVIGCQFVCETEADFEYFFPNICIDNTVSFDNLSNIQAPWEEYNIIWNFGDGTTSNEISPSHLYENIGEYEVSLTISINDSCTSTISQIIELPSIELNASYQCQTDDNGNNTGFGILNIQATEGAIIEGGADGDLVADGTSVVITATSVDGCTASTELTIDCPVPCLIELGDMPQDEQLFCETGIASAQISSISVPEGATTYYALHTQIGDNALGEILATNDTGEFNFDDIEGIAYYQTYYISFVAEDEVCGTLYSFGPPVIWVAPINILVQQDCEESANFYQFDMLFTFTGGLPQLYPDDFTYTVAGTINGDNYEYSQTYSTLVLDLEPYFVEVNDDLGCSAQTDGVFDPCSKTAIELLTFRVNEVNGSNQVNWSTASEHQNDFFILEHSINGIDFEPLSQIKGAGNSSTLKHYQYIHQNPPRGINYYRLKSVDFDGKKSISEIILIKNEKNIELILYPQPAQDILNIHLETFDSQIIKVKIFNSAGQLLLHENTISQIKIENFSPGLYFFETFYKRQRITSKFFKE